MNYGHIDIFCTSSYHIYFIISAPCLSRLDSLSDPIGGSEPVSGSETIYLGLFTCFFFQSLTYTCGYTNNFCNNQKSFTYTKELPPEWYPLKSIQIC